MWSECALHSNHRCSSLMRSKATQGIYCYSVVPVPLFKNKALPDRTELTGLLPVMGLE